MESEGVGGVCCGGDGGGEDAEGFVDRGRGVGDRAARGEVGVGADGGVCVEDFRHF